MRYVYTINSIGLKDIVFFASKRAALNYAIKHNIRMADGRIKIFRCTVDVALNVRNDFYENSSKSS